MYKLPTDAEIKSCNKVCVIFKEPFQEYCLEGKPLNARIEIATREINIETEKGYYSFPIEMLASIQFLK